MKHVLLFTVLLLAAFPYILAQTKPGGYAYSQEVIPGIRAARTIDEKGNITETAPKSSPHYLLYITASSASPVSVTKAWINGKLFNASAEKISAPVILKNPSLPGDKGDTLIGVSKKNLWQVQLKGEDAAKAATTGSLQKAISRNAVVIAYQRNGKSGLICLKSIKKLPAVSLQ
jgi:hypothetical protein